MRLKTIMESIESNENDFSFEEFSFHPGDNRSYGHLSFVINTPIGKLECSHAIDSGGCSDYEIPGNTNILDGKEISADESPEFCDLPHALNTDESNSDGANVDIITIHKSGGDDGFYIAGQTDKGKSFLKLHKLDEKKKIPYSKFRNLVNEIEKLGMTYSNEFIDGEKGEEGKDSDMIEKAKSLVVKQVKKWVKGYKK